VRLRAAPCGPQVHWMYRCRNYRNMAIIFFIFAVILVIILWVAGAFKNV
jgi:uncharacterized protein with PQ loop repeat